MVMKRTKPKRKPKYITTVYDNPRYKMNWGKFDGRRVTRIPAQYILNLERDGWALKDMLIWISQNREALEARAKEENASFYTQRYDLKFAYK